MFEARSVIDGVGRLKYDREGLH